MNGFALHIYGVALGTCRNKRSVTSHYNTSDITNVDIMHIIVVIIINNNNRNSRNRTRHYTPSAITNTDIMHLIVIFVINGITMNIDNDNIIHIVICMDIRNTHTITNMILPTDWWREGPDPGPTGPEPGPTGPGPGSHWLGSRAPNVILDKLFKYIKKWK